MSTRYRCEIRDRARDHLHSIGRAQDTRSIGMNTSMEKLRKLASFSSIEDMYSYFNHVPSRRDREGLPGNHPTPCYLLFGESSVRVTRFGSTRDLIDYIGLDYGSCKCSINNILRNGGGRLHIGKYIFAITRRYTTAIEAIPISSNDRLNVRVAAILEGVPNTRVSMYDIAREVGVETGEGVTRRLCEHFGIRSHGTNHTGKSGPARHTALTNLRTRETLEFRTIGEASRFLRVRTCTLIDLCTRRESVPLYGDRYSIDIDYSEGD